MVTGVTGVRGWYGPGGIRGEKRGLWKISSCCALHLSHSWAVLACYVWSHSWVGIGMGPLQSPSTINYFHSKNLNKYFKMGRIKREVGYLVDNDPQLHLGSFNKFSWVRFFLLFSLLNLQFRTWREEEVPRRRKTVLHVNAQPLPGVPFTRVSLCQFTSPRMVAPAWYAAWQDCLECWEVRLGLLVSHDGAAYAPCSRTAYSRAPPPPPQVVAKNTWLLWPAGGDRALGAGLAFPWSFSTECWRFTLTAAVESSLRTGIMSVWFASVFPAPSIVYGTKLSK